MARSSLSKAKRISIREVAKDCGVALSTVSNALAGKTSVAEATRLKVEEAAKRLGYRASGVARALRMQRTFTIGVLMADVSNPSSPDFLRGIEDVADQEKCSLLLCNTDEILEKQISHMKVLLDRQVDGLVLVSQHCDAPEVRELLDSGTPFVLLQRRSLAHKDDYVGADNQAGISAAVQHLVELGHRRIGYMRGPVGSSTVAERVAAFQRVAAEHGLDTDDGLIVQGNYQIDGGYEAASRLLDLENPPTAILAANDMSAMGTFNAAHERGLRIPQDISVVGLDNIQMASFSFIDLTTINLPKRDMGAAAVTLLMQRIRKKRTVTAKEVSFPMELVVRGSTGVAPRTDAVRKRKGAGPAATRENFVETESDT
jgi:LacI family transcriptional regulator